MPSTLLSTLLLIVVSSFVAAFAENVSADPSLSNGQLKFMRGVEQSPAKSYLKIIQPKDGEAPVHIRKDTVKSFAKMTDDSIVISFNTGSLDEYWIILDMTVGRFASLVND
jgi:hypothetical protein